MTIGYNEGWTKGKINEDLPAESEFPLTLEGGAARRKAAIKAGKVKGRRKSDKEEFVPAIRIGIPDPDGEQS